MDDKDLEDWEKMEPIGSEIIYDRYTFPEITDDLVEEVFGGKDPCNHPRNGILGYWWVNCSTNQTGFLVKEYSAYSAYLKVKNKLSRDWFIEIDFIGEELGNIINLINPLEK